MQFVLFYPLTPSGVFSISSSLTPPPVSSPGALVWLWLHMLHSNEPQTAQNTPAGGNRRGASGRKVKILMRQSLTVRLSSSENNFLNFPGTFWNQDGKETEDLKSTHECGWAESTIHFGKQFMSYLPRLSESTDGWTVQPHNDGKEWVQVPLCFTAEREEMKAVWVHETNHFAFREIMSCFKGCFLGK